MRWSWNPGGRNEVSSFLVLSLLLLILVSSYTLMAYWTSLERLSDERLDEARAWARALASRIGGSGALPRPEDLRDWAPAAYAASVFDETGRLVVTSRLEEGLGLWTQGKPLSPQAIAGTARFVHRGSSYHVQVDLWSSTLRARSATMKILIPLVVGVDLGVLFLLLFYARRLLAPLDRILDQARDLGAGEESKDEIAFWVRAFEKGLQSLARPEEVELQALEKALGSSMESGVLLSDAENRIMSLNPAGAEILDLPGDVTGRGLEEVLPRHPELWARLEPALREGRSVQREECRIHTPAGAKSLGLTAHPLRRDDGEAKGLLILFADLTEIQKRLADDRLDQSLKQLGELTAGIAHEMRNGLATIKGYLALIDRSGEPSAIQDFVSEIRSETEALHRTLEEFLTFARPGGRQTEEVDLRSLVHRASADPGLAEARIRVEVELSTDVPAVVRGDGMLLAKALANLLHNAHQAQAQAEAVVEAPLLVVLRRGEDGYEIEVSDRGIGIPSAIKDRLFEPFVTGREGGVGLGLALTRRIALLHGGSIELSRREGGGATAVLTLPAGTNVTDGSDTPDEASGRQETSKRQTVINHDRTV